MSAVVAYRTTGPDVRLHIGIGFEDEAGNVWNRVNTEQPVREAVREREPQEEGASTGAKPERKW